jgi:large subunit ribosomal protein L4
MNIEALNYNKSGEKQANVKLSPDIFGIEPRIPLLTQYIHVYKSNQRQGTSKVKTRAEVSGGGKKPWRQKGTGRARHGSIRSPIWRGGGVTHGPSPKSWKLQFPKKMRILALKSALSIKQAKSAIKIVEAPAIRKPSSEKMYDLLGKMGVRGKVLFVQKDNNLVVRKSLSNLKNVKCILVETLNPYDVLLANQVVFTEDALSFLESKYENK